MRTTLRFAVLLLAWLTLLRTDAWAQACGTTSTVDYATATTGTRKGSTETVGTTNFQYNYGTGANGDIGAFQVGTNGTLGSAQVLIWQVNVAEGTTNADQVQVTLQFSRPVANFSMSFIDFDAGTQAAQGSDFIDELRFQGYPTLTSNTEVIGNQATTGSANTFNGTNLLTGTAPSAANSTAGNATIRFTQAVQRVVLTFDNTRGVTAGNSRLHTTGISSVSWCRAAPVANSVTSNTVLSSVGAVSISPLSSTVDGTVQSYTLTSAPNPATQGTLFYNSAGNTYVAVSSTQVLTPAQAASLRFAPVAGSSGDVTFGYRVTDNVGILSANTATYRIPVNNAPCTTAAGTLNYSSVGAGQDWKARPNQPIPAGSSFTTVGTSGYDSPDANSTLVTADLNNTRGLIWTTDYANTTANTSTVTYNFNRAVSNFTVRVSDIDRVEDNGTLGIGAAAFIDEVTFTGANGGSSVLPGLAPSTPSTTSVRINGNTATGTANVDNTTDGTVIAYFASPITSLTLTYRNTSTFFTNPTDNAISIELLSFCRLAPVANDITNTNRLSSQGQAPINNLTSSVDGTAQSYTISGLNPAQGTFFVGNTVLNATNFPGLVLTPAQATQLAFSPATNFVGTAGFTYTVTDDAGVRDLTPATYTIPVTAAAPISGVVFEDVNYGGGSGRSQSASSGVGRGGATVELYNASGALVATTTTAATGTVGAYNFANVPSGTYRVRVVNSTVSSSRLGAVAGLLPVQTFNGTTNRVGGEAPERQDAAANSGIQTLAALTAGTATPQSLATVTISDTAPAAITNVDFGFNFDVVVNTNNAGQGSLRQFVLNANALGGEASLAQSGSRVNAAGATVALPTGTETSIFMIPSGAAVAGQLAGLPSGLTTSTTNGITSNVANINITTVLPNITGANTSIDGTTQTFNIGNTNNVPLGTGGTVGTSGTALAQFNGPEVQVKGVNNINGITIANNTNNTTVRGLSIYGFNTSILGGVNGTGTRIEQNVIGASAVSFTDPGAGIRTQNEGINLNDSDNGFVTNNLIGFNGSMGIWVLTNGNGSNGNSITGNEIRGNGLLRNAGNGERLVFDGIELQGASTNNTVSGNLITANLGHGIDTFGNTIGGNTITGNTISNNGVGVATNTGEEGSGLRVFGATNTTTISNNVLTGNNGSGVLLLGTANRVTISQNAMSGNTRLGIDLLTTGETNLGSTAPGTPFWNGNTGTTPNVTLNDNGDTAAGGNGLLNFPVITSSTLVGTNLVVTGYARPGSLIELFLATPLTTDPTNTNKGFGQGSAYLGSFTEGTAGTDTNNGTGSYGVGGATVNGLNQGTDNTNLFTFTIPLTGNFAGIAAGSVLTSTATLGNSTSEFSGNVAVNTGPVPNTLTNVSIPNTNGATVLNPNLSGTANGTLSTGTANSIAYYTVTSLPASGTLTYNGTVLTTGNIATTQIANPGLLTYTPVAGFMGGSVSFTYTATDANGVTSATNNNGGTVTNGPATYTIPVAVPSISGYVYEDANYGGGAGRSRATLGAAAVGRAGARVELYDNTGTFVTSAITDINGQYTLPVLASTTYTVRVVDNTVISARTGATFTGTAATGYTSNQLAVQTYNGTTDRVGGEAPTKADAPAGTTGTTLASLNTGTTIAQSQFGLTTGTTLTTTGPDFGFNFDVVTNTNDAGQGSLRQFITNANALGDENLLAQSGSNSVNTLPAGKETSIFMIPSGNAVAGLRAGLISGLTGGVAVIAPATALPIISGPNTYIDGSTQTFNVGNTNNVTLGVGGTVGTAATALSQVNGPEVQLVGSTTTVINTGLNVATTGAGTNLIGLAVYGFGNNAGGGDNDGTANIISAADNFSLSRSVVGTSATSFTTPNVPNLSTNVRITAGSNVAITNNLVGFSALSGIRMGLDIGTGVTVTNNEIRSSSQSANGVGYDGLQIRGSRVTASGNLFVNNAAQGVDAFNSAGSNLITGNTITNNGIGFATNAPLETAGIRLTGTGNTISLNIISNNYGAGVQVTSNAASVISQNAVFGNGTILSGNGTVATGQIGIDLLRDTDNGNLGTGPFVTINDNGDTDGGANGLLNFPVITTSTIQNGNLLVRGFATAGARIEFFVAAPDASGFGEGQTYFAMRTEGLTADDLDNTAGPYSGLINGRNQGAETNQNRFSFSIPLSSLTAAQQAALTASGAQLTSTATLLMAVNGNVGTSEFSGNSPINTPPVPRDVANVTVPNNSGPVVLNPNLTATANGSANGVTNTIASYTVSPASIGTLFFNGTAVTAATVVPAANLNQLTYQPVAGSTTTATFTYTATDANGIVSTTHFNEAGTTITDGPATYRIPVGATADVATTVNGPKELNAGQPSGTYLATFTNNGINVAEGVTQKVTLPAGATLTSAQLTVIQNAYPGTTYSTATRELYFTGATTTLASGATNSFRFAFTAPTTTGTLTGVNTLNSNVTTTSNEVGITANNQATLNLNVNPVADVATTVTGNGPINAGAQGRFTVEFRNLSATGPQTANGVVAMVQLPAGLGIVDVTGGSYNNSTGLVTYAGIMSLNSGQLVSSIITYTQPTAAAVTATASISTTSNEAGQTANNSAAATNNTRAVYDVTTAISGPATVTAGNQVVYNVSTINNGATSAAPNVTQTVTLPAGATNIFVTDGATVSGTTVTFPAISSLAAGQTVNNTVSFTAPGANYAVGASVASAPADANTANNTASVNTAVTAPPVPAANANTFVTVTTPATSATAGTAVTFTVTQGNAGKDAATGVVTRVAIPTGLPISGANAVRIGGNAPTSIAGTVATYAGGATYDSSTGIVTFPTITSQSAGAANNTYTITLVTPASGVVTATANVTATTPDSEAANSVATTQVTVNSAATDVATTLSGPTSAMPGERLTYTVTTTNNGPAPAGNVVQTVTVPAGLAISGVNALTIGGNAPTSVNGGVAAYAGGATYNSNTGVVTFPAIASQAGGSSVTNVIAYNAPANNNTSLANTAAVTTSTAETGVANNRAIVSTTLMTSSDVQVALTGPATIVAGNPLTYAVTTTNNGVSVAGSVATTVQLPTGLAGVVVRNAAGVVLTNSTTSGYNSADGIVRFPAVTNQSAGSDASTSGTITFNAPAGTNLLVPTATATVTGTTDQVAGNNSASLATTVQPATTAQNDLSTIITSSVPTQTAGQPVTFTVTTSNATTSTGAATGVVQTVQLPAGLTSNGGTVTVSGTGVYDNATGLVTFPAVSLPNTGAARTATNTIIISQAPGTDPLVAIASVRGNESDPNVADNTTAPLSVPITPNVDVATSVTGPATITPGSTVSYSVVTRNNSPSPATNVSQTLTLPAGVTSYSLNGGAPITVAAGATITIPVPSTINPGTANTVTNTISFTAPAMSFALTSNVTATGDAGTMGNNVSTQNTATTRNSAPVAANTMNTLQTPEGNTAGPLLLSALSATDADGNTDIRTYTINSIPLPSQGVLRLGTIALGAGDPIALADIAKLTFDPVTGYVGNASFTFSATDAAGAVSAPATFLIAVAQDINSVYTNEPTKGIATNNGYQNGDAISNAFDVNGGRYNMAAAITDSGVRSAALASGSNALPAGVTLNSTTGAITVSDRLLLRSGSYTVTITTVDVNGGTNTQNVTFTIGERPLPVELKEFAVRAVKVNALLDWSTASEKNSDRFEIERSLNGTTFEKIGTVRGQGTTQTTTTYAFTDAGIGAKVQGVVYYRLRQVDTDGTVSYSPVRTVRFEAQAAVTAKLSVFPNPATSSDRVVTLDLTTLPKGTYQASLLDATGRLIRTYSVEGGVNKEVDVQTLPTGTYIVVVRGNGLNLSQRLIKE